MNTINNYKNILQQVHNVTNGILTETGTNEFSVKCDKFNQLLERSKYVKVPLVGVFSAGKSSILNVFTQKYNALPIDTTPETAVAYELYYGEDEKVDLFRNKEIIDTNPLSEIKSLQTQPGDIACVYMNSQPIKQLQEKGIVLVDMPGIGSGNNQHDAAIMNYIEFGTAFILMMEAEQGTLRDSTLRFIEELKRYNLMPAILISKIDKKPLEVINDIVEEVKFDAKRVLDNEPFVGTVSAVNNDLKSLSDYLETLDAEALLRKKVGGSLKAIIDSAIADLSNQIEDKGKSVEEAKAILKKIEDELANVQNQLPTNDAICKSPETYTTEIMENIDLALKDKAGEIARMVVNKASESEINSMLTSIIRAELLVSVKERAEDYSRDLSNSVNSAVTQIAHIEINGGFLQNFNLGTIIEVVATIFGKGAISKFLAKWGKVLIEPLQAILDAIFGKSTSDMIAEVKSKILNECIPNIINSLRPDVLSIVSKTQEDIDDSVKGELQMAIDKKKDSLRTKLNDIQTDEQTTNAQIATLKTAINTLNNIKNEL